MTPDRDELFLQKTLQEGLHPADRDLWPAVAEALPGAAPVSYTHLTLPTTPYV